MATTLYFRNTTNHIGAFATYVGDDLDLEKTSGSTTSHNYGTAGTTIACYYSAADTPGFADWQTGDYTWYLDVTTANAGVILSTVRVSRYDSTFATEKAFGTASPNLTLSTTGLKSGTVSFASPNPANRSANDRLVVTLTFTRASSYHGTQAVDVDINGASDSRLDTPLTFGQLKQGTISESSVSVGAGSATRVLNSTRPISDTPTVSVSGSATGSKLYSVSIGESSVSVGAQSAERTRTSYGTISNEDSVSTSETLTGTAKYFETILEDSVIVGSDSIARETDHYRSIDETTVSVSESIESTKIPSGPTAKLFDVHFVEFPEDISDEVVGITGRTTSQHTHKFNIEIEVSTTKTHKYDTLTQVSTSKTHKFDIFTEVSTAKTHLYNIVETVTATRTHKWNIISTVSVTKTHRYNINIPISQVSTTKTHKYDVIQKITAPKTHIYSVIGLLTVTKTHKYYINIASETSKTHKYDVIISVSRTVTHLYDLISKAERTQTHKYNILSKPTSLKTHKYNVLSRVTKSNTHRYNLSNAVSTTKTHIWNILAAVTRTNTHKYNVIGRITRTHIHRWNSGGKVATTKKHIYDVGQFFELPEGAGSATVAHIKFPPRVRIVDIIADIRNLAIANVELRPFEPKIICVGFVEINENSPILKTASGKARHRIASTLIIPQILDTIDNLAVSGRIGIEELLLGQDRQFQIRSHISLHQTLPQIHVNSYTQIIHPEIIRLSSFTELGHKTRIASVSKLQLQFINNIQLKTKEIMTKEREQILKLFIDVLKSDDVFY